MTVTMREFLIAIIIGIPSIFFIIFLLCYFLKDVDNKEDSKEDNNSDNPLYKEACELHNSILDSSFTIQKAVDNILNLHISVNCFLPDSPDRKREEKNLEEAQKHLRNVIGCYDGRIAEYLSNAEKYKDVWKWEITKDSHEIVRQEVERYLRHKK